MQIAAVASAVGLAGSAIANDNAIGQNPQAADGSAASVIDQSTPSPAYGARVDSALQSNDLKANSSTPSMSTNQIDTNSSAASDLNSNASSANDLNHNSMSTNEPSGTSSSGAVTDVNPNPSSSMNDNRTNAPGTNASRMSERGLNNGLNENDSSASGATQGSTMQSPKSTTGLTSGLPSSANGGERLSTTNSGNFDAWASDYASQHNGRISREEFLNEMGQRFDQLDKQHQGSLTPNEVQEIFIFTPANPSAARGLNGSSDSAASNGGASSTTSNTNLQ
jgi:hypothetical protein